MAVMMNKKRCVILGAGHAGVQAAHALRQNGYSEQIVLVDAWAGQPYHRPPLSKTFLLKAESRVQPLKPDGFYSQLDIDCVFGHMAVDVVGRDRQIRLDCGKTLDYDDLIIATGCTPRSPIAGATVPQDVLTLRTEQDATAIRARAATASSALIIGAGFVGLELAHSLAKLGLEVTVLERAERVLARVTSNIISDAAERCLRQSGIRLETGVFIDSFIYNNGRCTGVYTEDGRQIEADLIIYGAGVLPQSQLADRLGLEMADGIVVDAGMRTSLGSVYAIGDLARPLYPGSSGQRIESVPNALEHAKSVAATITGRVPPQRDCPWFWSDQGDMKLQIVGLATGADTIIPIGNVEEMSFSVLSFRQGQLVAVDSINDPRTHALARRIMSTPVSPPPALMSQGAEALAQWLMDIGDRQLKLNASGGAVCA